VLRAFHSAALVERKTQEPQQCERAYLESLRSPGGTMFTTVDGMANLGGFMSLLIRSLDLLAVLNVLPLTIFLTSQDCQGRRPACGRDVLHSPTMVRLQPGHHNI
jgi:hypothetical protein